MKRARRILLPVMVLGTFAFCTSETFQVHPALFNLCAVAEECPAGTSCVDSACRVDDGGWCSTDSDCVNVCVDAVCCISPCDGICQSCNREGACENWSGSCDDADPCTGLDTCVAGGCVGGSLLTTACASFADEAAAIGIAPVGSAHGVAWADYDNDGDLDLYVGRADTEPALLYRNDGGNFIATNLLTLDARGGFFADPDNDGDLDLLVTEETRFYSNNGAGQFTERTKHPLRLLSAPSTDGLDP